MSKTPENIEAFETGALIEPEATEEELLTAMAEPAPEDTSGADPDADVEVEQDPEAVPEDHSDEVEGPDVTDLGVLR